MARVPASSFTAFESVTVAATAIGFTAATISGKSVAFLTLEDAQIRYRLDGTDPTASVGHLLEAGDDLTLRGSTVIANFRAIRTGGSNGTLRCSYGT